MNQRERFEAWAVENLSHANMRRTVQAKRFPFCEEYVSYRINCSWLAWQEAEAYADARMAALVDALEQVIKAAPSGGPLWHGSEQIIEARAALAAHHKQGAGE